MDATAGRLRSVDALRGLAVAAMLLVNNPGDWNHVPAWLEHSPWNGCTFADFIFPFFLFIVGVSLALSLGTGYGAGHPAVLARRILWRALRIVALGLALEVVRWFLITDGHAYRPTGVLQRIGLCYATAGLVVLYVRDVRWQWALMALVLVGYEYLLSFAGTLQPGVNLADRVDSALLGQHAYEWDPRTHAGRDPEGFLSTLPAVVTVLLGVRAGEWLRAGRTQALLTAGLTALLAGYLWSPRLPFNKQLWTSSFVLWTGGAAFLALALAHYLVDVRRLPAIGASLGINAILAYAGAWLAACLLAGTGSGAVLYAALVGLLPTTLPPWVPSVTFALVFTALWWALMYGLARRGWRIVI